LTDRQNLLQLIGALSAFLLLKGYNELCREKMTYWFLIFGSEAGGILLSPQMAANDA
jgi:hypothetical protein